MTALEAARGQTFERPCLHLLYSLTRHYRMPKLLTRPRLRTNNMAQSLITEEMRLAIGKESPPLSTVIEKGAISKFAEAIADLNPLWCNQEQASNTRYKGVIAPPTFLRSVNSHALTLPFDAHFKGVLDGGSEWEYFEPVRPGDTITATTKLLNLREARGPGGPMLYLVNLTTYKNQRNQAVATQKVTLVLY